MTTRCASFHALRGDDIRLTLIKGGDHRLSRPRDIALLIATIEELAQASDRASAQSRSDASPSR